MFSTGKIEAFADLADNKPWHTWWQTPYTTIDARDVRCWNLLDREVATKLWPAIRRILAKIWFTEIWPVLGSLVVNRLRLARTKSGLFWTNLATVISRNKQERPGLGHFNIHPPHLGGMSSKMPRGGTRKIIPRRMNLHFDYPTFDSYGQYERNFQSLCNWNELISYYQWGSYN